MDLDENIIVDSTNYMDLDDDMEEMENSYYHHEDIYIKIGNIVYCLDFSSNDETP
jgi:hypothetical protein